MRALIVLVVLFLLYLVVRLGTDMELGPDALNPALIGYGALFAAGIVVAELLRPVMKLMSPLSRFVVVAVLAGLVWTGFAQALKIGLIPEALLKLPGQEPAHAVYEARVPLAWDGLYRVVAQINARSVAAVVDTGTPLVVLQYEEAERIGFPVEKVQYDQKITIGNSKVPVTLVPFLSVQIDKVVVLDVAGAVAAKGAIDGTRIGLSFLNRLEKVELDDGELSIRN